MKKFLKQYRLEIIILLTALAIDILLLKWLALRYKILFWAWVVRTKIGNLLVSGTSDISSILSRLGAFEYISILTMLAAIGFIGYRVRNNIVRSDSWRSNVCPICGGSLHRSHRSPLDRLLITFFLFEGKRYKCSNCKWSGLKRA